MRPFTSDSYKAIKDRERRKSWRRVHTNTYQHPKAKSLAAPTQRFHSTTGLQTTDTHFLASDISTSHSGTFQEDQAMTQDQNKSQTDIFCKDTLNSPGTVSDHSFESRPSGADELSTPSRTTAISIDACGSDSAVKIGVEHGTERKVGQISDHDAPIYENDHIITDRDDEDMFSQRSTSRTCCDTKVRAVTSSPWPADGHGSRCRPASGEQLAECFSTRSPNLEPLDSTTDVATPVISLRCLPTKHTSDVSLATFSVDEINHAASVAGMRSYRSQAESGRNGSSECNPRPPNSWTRERDDLLLHLRNTAQLNWGYVLTYFPGTTLGAVKSRLKHLNRCQVDRQAVGNELKSRVQRRRPNTCRGVSSRVIERKKLLASSTAKSLKDTVSNVAKSTGLECHRHVTKRVNAEKWTTTPDDIYQRTSRSGRAIRHPFRHRPCEGYF